MDPGFYRYHDLPKRTGMTATDRDGPKRTFVDTETDSLSTETDSLGTETDRNGLSWIPKRTLSTETDSLGTETDRNGPKRTFVNTETDSLGTES